MNYSLGEVESLCKKAARGAGYSWGLAEDAGRAVRWLESRGLAGLAALADLLETLGTDLSDHRPAEGWSAPAPLCAIQTGAALSDHAFLLSHDAPIQLGETLHPMLLIPFLAGRRQVDLTWGAARLSVSENGIHITGALGPVLAAKAGKVDIVLSNKPRIAALTPRSRALIRPEIYARLNRFAHKTYAPATEASRLAGAGAGLSDND